MQDILNQHEIDNFLMSLEKMLEVQLPPLPHVKPSQISQIADENERISWEKRFANGHYLYVYPLEKLLEYITKKTGQEFYKIDYQDASIIQRAIMVEKLLEQKGYSKEQIMKLVPTSEDEQRLLIKARSLGFKDDIACYNEYRIAAANQFIKSLNNTEEVERKIA